jgi:hypothetical protein
MPLYEWRVIRPEDCDRLRSTRRGLNHVVSWNQNSQEHRAEKTPNFCDRVLQ